MDATASEQHAIDLMKAGHAPDSVHAHLRARGMSEFDARALVEKLLALRSQAAVLDPQRLREEAKWMFMRGAPVEHVLDHWKSLGIADEHARPEVQRLLAEVRHLRPCDRCCTPMAIEESFFDANGRRVCRGCNARDAIGASERRVLEQVLQTVGVPTLVAESVSGVGTATGRVPWCPRCRLPAVNRDALHPQTRDQIHPGWTYVCHQCLAGLR